MLASTPPRNNRPELIADDGQDVFFPARSIAWHRPDREAGHRPRFTRCDDTSDR